jgi:ketosteroid isomerase-like protein
MEAVALAARGPGRDTARAMSEKNVQVRNEVVRRGLSAFVSDTDAFRDILHPEIEWYGIEKNRRPSKGIEAAMWDRNQWLDTWDEHRLDVEEVVEEGDNVVALVHLTGRGKASGVEVDVRFYAQFKVRDGKVAYIYDHEDREAALEAAGLRG